MTGNPGEVVVAEGGGRIMVADVGTTAPTTAAAAWGAGWVDLGYTDENGVTLTAERTTQDIGAWQEFDPIRILLTARKVTAAFSLRQWNHATILFAFGGGSISTVSAGQYRFNLPDGVMDARALGIEFVDQDRTYRIIIPQGIVEDPTAPQFARTVAADLAIGFRAFKAAGVPIAYFLSDDVAMVEEY